MQHQGEDFRIAFVDKQVGQDCLVALTGCWPGLQPALISHARRVGRNTASLLQHTLPLSLDSHTECALQSRQDVLQLLTRVSLTSDGGRFTPTFPSLLQPWEVQHENRQAGALKHDGRRGAHASHAILEPLCTARCRLCGGSASSASAPHPKLKARMMMSTSTSTTASTAHSCSTLGVKGPQRSVRGPLPHEPQWAQ